MFITMFTRVNHWTPALARSIYNVISFKSILILFSNRRLSLRDVLSVEVFRLHFDIRFSSPPHVLGILCDRKDDGEINYGL
jgi:hypothetical protein